MDGLIIPFKEYYLFCDDKEFGGSGSAVFRVVSPGSQIAQSFLSRLSSGNQVMFYHDLFFASRLKLMC